MSRHPTSLTVVAKAGSAVAGVLGTLRSVADRATGTEELLAQARREHEYTRMLEALST